jgi:hypothetical protein
MEMKMRHRLARVRPIIGGNPKSTLQQPLLLGNSGCQRQRIRHDLGVSRLMSSQRRNVAPRHHEHVDRRLRRQVPKRDAVRTLGDKLGPELTAGYATKNAIIGGRVSHSHSTDLRTFHPPVVRSAATLCSIGTSIY